MPLCRQFAVQPVVINCVECTQLRCCRLSCCVAGNCDLAVKETDVKETLELLGERLGFPQPQAEWAPWVPPSHPLANIERALRYT